MNIIEIDHPNSNQGINLCGSDIHELCANGEYPGYG